MKQICRLCGISLSWEGEWWRSKSGRPIAELCSRCNDYYGDFYLRNINSMDRHMIQRDELLLTEFVAHRLRQLARRHLVGKSITRCEVDNGNFDHRCPFFWSEEVEGRKLCGHHVKIFRGQLCAKRWEFYRHKGSVLMFAPNDESNWYDEVTKFFHANF